MVKYFIAAKVAVGSLLVVLFLALLCLALYNQLSINFTSALTDVPSSKVGTCNDLNITDSQLPNSSTITEVEQNITGLGKYVTELEKLRNEVCIYRITYAEYNERLNRREQQIANSENHQTSIITVISVIIGLVTLSLGAGTWLFSSTIANNDVKVKEAQKKFIDFQEVQQMQSDCEQELLKNLSSNGFEDYIVISLMVKLRIYLPLLASGDKARIKRAAQALASYVTDNNLSAMTEYARHCRSKTPEELHYLFNFALPKSEQI